MMILWIPWFWVKALHLICFRLGGAMTLSNVLNRVKMLPGGHLGIRFRDATERNQRFGGPLVLPRLFIPPHAAKYTPVILWEVVIACVTPDGRPHPHNLVGPGCKDGVCIITGGDEEKLAMYLCPPVFHDVPGLNLKHAGPRLSRVRPKLDSPQATLKTTVQGALFGNLIDISGLKIRPVDERQAKASLHKKQHTSKVDTVFPRPPTCPNVHDPFNRGFAHKNSMVDLSTVRLTFSVTILIDTLLYGGSKVFKPIASCVIEDTTPRILDIAQSEINNGNKTMVRLKVSRDDVRVEFYDQSCSWREEGVTRSVSKPGIFSRLISSESKTEITVEMPEFPNPVTSPHKVSVRLLPMDGQPPGPATSFTFLPPPIKTEEKTEEREDNSYLALLRRTTENIPSEPQVLRPVKDEEHQSSLDALYSASSSEEEFKKASQRALIDKFFKSKS